MGNPLVSKKKLINIIDLSPQGYKIFDLPKVAFLFGLSRD